VNRREFVTTLGASALLAGCVTGSGSNEPTGTSTPDRTTTQTREETTDTIDTGLAEFGTPSTICEEEIRPDPGIYAIVEPAFASDWSSRTVEQSYQYDSEREGLVDEQTVIGITTADGARAYPLTVLNIHEVVNDTFGGPVVVTFCPLCRSGVVADRRLRGEATLFAVSGLLWRPERVQAEASEKRNRTFGASATGGEETSVRHSGNLVMYDAATRSYWSQILARGICGPHRGTELDIRPSAVASWGEWRRDHPDTEVLLPPPHSEAVSPGTILGEGDPGE
jgi:hypothetical protein